MNIWSSGMRGDINLEIKEEGYKGFYTRRKNKLSRSIEYYYLSQIKKILQDSGYCNAEGGRNFLIFPRIADAKPSLLGDLSSLRKWNWVLLWQK